MTGNCKHCKKPIYIVTQDGLCEECHNSEARHQEHSELLKSVVLLNQQMVESLNKLNETIGSLSKKK